MITKRLSENSLAASAGQVMRVGFARAVLAACLLSGVGVADAAAAPGDLVQKPGAAGCVSMIGFCEPGSALSGAAAIAVSPDGTSAYVASGSDDAVAVFDRGGDGTLVQKPGPAGCISETGVGRCRDGTALTGAGAVAVSPDGRSVYAASYSSDAVAVFDRAPDGRLAQKPGTAGCISDTGAGPCVDGTAVDFPDAVTVSPDGQSVYVASGSSDAVAVFDRAGDGTLTQKPGTAGCISETGAGPCIDGKALEFASSVAVSPDGQSVYVASADSAAVAVFDRSGDGTLTQKAGDAGCIAEDPYVCADGAGLTFAKSVAVSPDGRSVYVASRIGAVATFDRTRNGRLTQKPDEWGCISGNGDDGCTDGTALAASTSVAVSPDGVSAYVAAQFSNALALFDRAPNGTLAQKPGAAGCIRDVAGGDRCTVGAALLGALSVTVSPDGRNVYVASWESIAVFDRETNPPPTPDTSTPVPSGLDPTDPCGAHTPAASTGRSLGERIRTRRTRGTFRCVRRSYRYRRGPAPHRDTRLSY